MTEDAYIVELVAGCLYLPVGIRLLALARRTGLAPARLLGTCFTAWGFGYVCYEAPGQLEALAPFELPLYQVGRLAFAIGCLAIAVFSARVFRPGLTWARALVWLVGLFFAVALAEPLLRGDFGMIELEDGASFWLEWIAIAIPSLWLCAEGFTEYARARRRLALGLTDPLSCHRFLLWGLFGMFQIGSTVGIVPMYVAYEVEARITPGMDALVGGFELLSIAALWLAFDPPRLYRERIACGRQTAGSTPG